MKMTPMIHMRLCRLSRLNCRDLSNGRVLLSAVVVLAGLAGFAAHAPARAADLAAGQKLVETQCASCHGKDAKTPIDPTFPKLAGQYDDYLAKALQDYQSGARKNAVMGGIAKPLSKKDIIDVSAYLSRLPGPMSHRR